MRSTAQQQFPALPNYGANYEPGRFDARRAGGGGEGEAVTTPRPWRRNPRGVRRPSLEWPCRRAGSRDDHQAVAAEPAANRHRVHYLPNPQTMELETISFTIC